MNDIWVISDTHWHHANMLTFITPDGRKVRPWLPEQVDEMDEYMVDRWNSVVKPQDKIYHLGDVAMDKKFIAIVGRCNGHKRLVRGNHDIHPIKLYLAVFDEVYATRWFEDVIMSHIPLHPESLGPKAVDRPRKWANIHGHVHNNVPQGHFGPVYYNVSVEMIDYTPVHIDEVRKRLREQCAA